MRKAILLALAMSCCATSAPHKSEVMNVSVGTLFTIDLPANRTTGYEWTVASSDGNAVRLLSSTYVERAHRPGMVGFGGLHSFRFKALRTGTEVLHFAYRRPWEKVAGETVDYTVHVKR